jgi:cell division protein FtsL
MSPFLKLAKANTKKHKRSRKTRNFLPRVKVGAASIGLLLAGILFFIGLFYLVQINDMATKGHEINALQKKVTELRDQNEKLGAQAAELSSIQNIQKTLQELNLVETNAVKYLRETSTDVAKR